MARSVRTWINNGKQNGAPLLDPAAPETIDDLYNQDITTPGIIRMPVCSAVMAYRAWLNGSPDTGGDNYPCTIAPGPNLCGDSTFVDQTTAASPYVDDCLRLAGNIAGTDGSWHPENFIGEQHQLLQEESCAFGIESLDVANGNVDYDIGAGDIVDVITESVDRFGGSGKVGAKGKMTCQGTVHGQRVEWGIYTNPNWNPG